MHLNLKFSGRLALLCAALAPGLLHSSAERRFYLPMDLHFGQISESVSGRKYEVKSANSPEALPGVKGDALRLDGYSTYVAGDVSLGTLNSFTFSAWCAMETWPIIEHDVQNETEMTMIAGNYDADAKQGFGFFVGRTGSLSFKFFAGGWPGEIKASQTLPLYRWNNLVAVGDGSAISFYNNGVLLGSTKGKGISGNGTFLVGKSAGGRQMDMFLLNTINGLVDEIEVYDEAIPHSSILAWQTDAKPLLSCVADGRYDSDIMRPRFHGMPSRNWTNECHGLVKYNGRYHLFFQKNPNGPYMSRLQWGHIVSDNLYDWEEMPIALGSDKWYDLKGCWSGCIALDDEVTGGKPNIIYTGVDYARAMIAQAAPADDELLHWSKKVNPIIDGRPAGLSDDFRDPYFFRNGNDAYIIVGTSKDGKGACTLHKYNNSSKQWSNNGEIFFSAPNAPMYGSFWEMPNVTKIGGRHLFTITPLGLMGGVKAMYYTGDINADGTFRSSGSPAAVELPGFAKEGFGLLSPSITQADGKTIAIGIVPDKLASIRNYELGWAHTYSLPREWSLDERGMLVQKPYSGLENMRLANSRSEVRKTLSGAESLGDMKERQIELLGEFTVADADFGFNLFKKGDKCVKLFYSPASGKLTVDMRGVERFINDSGVFDGLYESNIPGGIAKGSVMKLHVFVDHSIIDIFVNDRYASSIRLFPTDADADGLEVFSEKGSTNAQVTAWKLSGSSTGVDDILADSTAEPANVDVYDIHGRIIRQGALREKATAGLDPGLYIISGKKVLVK